MRTYFPLIALAAMAVLAAGCNFMADWRDSQIRTSHQAAQGMKPVEPPAVPIVVPDRILQTLPADSSFTFTQFVSQGDSIELKAISAWDTATTANWMLGRLREMGYDSGDNRSRILEGVDFYGSKVTRYDSIYAMVTLNKADQCMVEIKSVPKD